MCHAEQVTKPVHFRARFVSDPFVYAQIWEDLQMIPDGDNDFQRLILIISSCPYISCGVTQLSRSVQVTLKSATTQRVRGAGFYAQKVQALKEQILVNEAEATL